MGQRPCVQIYRRLIWGVYWGFLHAQFSEKGARGGVGVGVGGEVSETATMRTDLPRAHPLTQSPRSGCLLGFLHAQFGEDRVQGGIEAYSPAPPNVILLCNLCVSLSYHPPPSLPYLPLCIMPIARFS